MKYPENIQDISTLHPDYLGFIFWEKSQRKFDTNEILEVPSPIKKVAVFVDEEEEKIKSIVDYYTFDVVQLHGSETPEFCEVIKSYGVDVIKAFSVDENFDFKQLTTYEPHIDYFLFDTKGKLPGGNGISFDWDLLSQYTLEKPFFLSGGIGLTSVDAIKSFLSTENAKYCHGIDVNSRFEKKKGFKNYSKLKRLKRRLYENEI
ncbi:phosphoribosylanthranilate isomerase [Flavobacterium sp. NRK F7]|uniref:phosphoribosylanthranilate isomerase n=1 Tax=Flavobacterium sp. NRK F7 TaxID=2954930 RepID=UPI002090E7FA|nr:phosphoribosylanthranilate isomerase [Flavobacterium sp. NRK F7]